MPLDDEARRYADELFNRQMKEILSERQETIVAVRQDYHRRNMIQSGTFISALARVSVESDRALGTAKMEALMTAYEKAGFPYDERTHAEISTEVAQYLKAQQEKEVGFLARVIAQTFSGGPPPQLQEAVGGELRNGIGGVIEDLMRELRIKRHEVVLDERRTRKGYAAAMGKRWDVFISHASEDKDEFVRPLATALRDSGLDVWYDESSLKVGDSLRRAIDYGLANSRFGVVVLSPRFFEKEWPQQELDGLTSMETAGVKVILPVWHNIGFEEVRRHSPILAGRVAAKSTSGFENVVRQLREAMAL